MKAVVPVVITIGERILQRLSGTGSGAAAVQGAAAGTGAGQGQGHGQGQGQGEGQGQLRKSWIDGIKEMSIHPETRKLGPVMAPLSAGISRYGIALGRLKYEFDTRPNAASDLPTQTINSQQSSIIQHQQRLKKGLHVTHSALELSLITKIKQALAASANTGNGSKKRKRKDKDTPVPAPVPASAPAAYAADDSDDDIFADAGEYVPVGTITTDKK
jgi:hypothetical protein